jgi:hypothetical protein
MNVPYQILDTLVPEAARTAERNAADEQMGRLFAAASRSRVRMARRARALAGRPHPARRRATFFRKAGPRSHRTEAAPPLTSLRAEFEIVAKPSRNGHRSPR